MADSPNFSGWTDTEDLTQDRLAEATFYNLTKDLGDLEFPEIPWDKLEIPTDILDALHKSPRMLTEKDLTDRVPKGSGLFDGLMESFSNHLKEEYVAGRITGAEYTKAYIQCLALAIQSGVQFLTSQESLYWQSIAAQLAALKAIIEYYTLQVNLYITKVNLCITRAQYASTKMGLAVAQEQARKVHEDFETTRANTLDSRSDGSTVSGLIAKQKKLYDEQATAYKRNTEIKTVDLWMDGYSVNKTVDEGLTPPSNLTNSTVDQVMTSLRTRVFDGD